MTMGILTVLWEKWVEFRHNFFKITSAAMIAPLLYILVFGFGVQTVSHGQPYLNFLIPGVVALTTMNGSFNAIAQTLNVQRLYEKAFDQVMISPTPLWSDYWRKSARCLCGKCDHTSGPSSANRPLL